MNSPREVLIEFMREMNAWERRCAEREPEENSGIDAFNDALRVGEHEYMEIFRRFCSSGKAIPRDYCYCKPPDYDPHGESIVAVNAISPDEIAISTKQDYGFKKSHVYRMILENGQWHLIDKVIVSGSGAIIPTEL